MLEKTARKELLQKKAYKLFKPFSKGPATGGQFDILIQFPPSGDSPSERAGY